MADETPTLGQVDPVADAQAEALGPPPVPPETPALAPDEQAQPGFWCRVIDGIHAGQIAVLLHRVADGGAFVRFRDTTYEHAHATVPFESLRPASHRGSQ